MNFDPFTNTLPTISSKSCEVGIGIDPLASFNSPKRCPQGHTATGSGRFCQVCGSPLTSNSANAPSTNDPNTLVSAPQITTPQISTPQITAKPFAPTPIIRTNDADRFERLEPLAPGYQVTPELFQWNLDAQAMARLRSITPLVSLAKTVSDKAGRRWIESSCNGIRLSHRQLPEIHTLAVRAARALGIERLPAVYLSGERPWDMATYGSEDQAFIVIGSALAASFRGIELEYLFAREMGRIVAGHTLWRTVIRFLVGEMNPRAGLLRGGITGLLDPGKWLEGAIELPLLGWARQAEITADRAGLVAVGDEAVARKVLLAWSLKAPQLPDRIDLDAWIAQQEEDSIDEGLQLTEMFSSSTPYIARRLKLLREYAADPYLVAHRNYWFPKSDPVAEAPAAKRLNSEPMMAVKCPSCNTELKVPKRLLTSDSLAIRCSNPNCRKVHVLKKGPAPNAAPNSSPNSSPTHPQSASQQTMPGSQIVDFAD